jgi:hypothetical protein
VVEVKRKALALRAVHDQFELITHGKTRWNFVNRRAEKYWRQNREMGP